MQRSERGAERHNRAAADGGIYNRGAVTLQTSTLSGNTGGSFGGGIFNFGPVGTVTVQNSTLSGNSTNYAAGGILNDFGAKLIVQNSTLSQNRAPGFRGGGILNYGALTLQNSTLSQNSAGSEGGGVATYPAPSTTSLSNNIIAGNTGGGAPDVHSFAGSTTSQGYNLIGNASGSGVAYTPTDLLNIDPLLGPLANNGGPTFTHALLPGSPAIDKGNSAPTLTTDQRGETRPYDNPAIANATPGNGSDIGAFEVQAPNTAPVANDDTVATNEDSAAIVTVLDNDTDADGHTLTITTVTQGTNGSVVDNGDGTVTYSPNANFNGTDSFTYTISDGQGGSDTATVNVTVNSVNDAAVADDDAATTPASTEVTINVLDGDTDPEGDTLTVSAVTQGANGTVVNNSDGTVTYTPNVGFAGTDTFTYTISDGNGGTDTATVTITVSAPVNTASAQVTGGGTIPGTTAGTQANFGLTAQIDKKGQAKGNLNYVVSGAGLVIRSTQITALEVSGTHARIFGKCTVNGTGSYNFVVDVDDLGEPGVNDTFMIRVSNGYTNGGTLTGGNIQIHK